MAIAKKDKKPEDTTTNIKFGELVHLLTNVTIKKAKPKKKDSS